MIRKHGTFLESTLDNRFLTKLSKNCSYWYVSYLGEGGRIRMKFDKIQIYDDKENLPLMFCQKLFQKQIIYL